MGHDLDDAARDWDNNGTSHDDGDDFNDYGPIVIASFGSPCAGDIADDCDGAIYPGQEIRGRNGEWFHVGCEL